MKCSICGHDNLSFINTGAGIGYQRCGNCGTEQQALTQDERMKMFAASQETFYSRDDLVYHPVARLVNTEKARKKLSGLMEYMKGGRLLEIGPGPGFFIGEAINKGFVVEAVEESDSLSEYLRTNMGIKVHNISFEKLTHGSDTFDGVYSSHVIEHVTEPVEHLKLSVRMACDKGYIFLSTPNTDCWEHAVAGNKWAMYSMGHLQLFSPGSLSMCLEKAGWDVIDIKTFSYAFDWLRAVLSRFEKPGKNVRKSGATIRNTPSALSVVMLKVFGVMLWPLIKLQSRLNKGCEIFIVARRQAG